MDLRLIPARGEQVESAIRPSQEFFDSQYRERVLRARAVDPAEKLSAILEHSSAAAEIMLAGARYQFPQATEAEVLDIVRRRLDMIRALENKRGHL
jgi:hypothetical protein